MESVQLLQAGKDPELARPADPRPLVLRNGEVSLENLTDFIPRVHDAVKGLEDAWKRGQLHNALGNSDYQYVLGDQIFDEYVNLTKTQIHSTPLRECVFEETLSGALGFLKEPKKVFKAQEIDDLVKPRLSESTNDLVPPPLVRRVLLIDGHAGPLFLRPDQICTLRQWGVGIEPSTVQTKEKWAAILYQACLKEIYMGLVSLRKIGQSGAYQNGEHFALRGGRDQQGLLFERLILDILNEHELIARHAPPFEDLLQKTDLRVKFPQLKRRHGARVQITFSASSARIAAKSAKIENPEEFILLSPATIASAVETRRTAPIYADIDFQALWSSLPAKPATTGELAVAIKTVCSRAIEQRIDDPRGPIAFVPQPLRSMIRRFVFAGAHETLKLLRERESSEGTSAYGYR